MTLTSSLAFDTSSTTLGLAGSAHIVDWPPYRRAQRASSSISSSEVLPANESIDGAKMTPAWMTRAFSRVAELSKRPDGWDTYGAYRLQVEILRAFVQVLDAYSYAIQSEPMISLTSSGGLLCSWESSRASVDLTFDPGELVRVYYEDAITGHEVDLSVQECEAIEKWLWQASSSS